MDRELFPVAIIGAGPAGIAAAIQLKRSNIDFIIFEKNQIGGLLRNAFLIENYPGFHKNISGIKLTSLYVKHLDRLKIKPLFNKVENIIYSDQNKLFTIKTGTSIFKSKFVIVAAGLRHKEPDIIKLLSKNIIKNIHYNVCDLNDPKNKKILIVGAGDAAFDYALNLSVYNKVTILNRTIRIKALKLLENRIIENPAIEYISNSCILNITSENNFHSVWISTESKKEKKKFDKILFAIGRKTDLSFISSQILKKRVELETEKVLHFIGDIVNGELRQATIAVGDGIRTAMEISKFFVN